MKPDEPWFSGLKAGCANFTFSYLTTATLDGLPNMIPAPFTDVLEDGLILIPDMFAQKTKVNLNENESAVLSVGLPGTERVLVLNGRAGIIQWGHPASYTLFGLRAGPVLERWGDWDTVEPVAGADEEIRPSVIAERGVIVFKPESVREVAP